MRLDSLKMLAARAPVPDCDKTVVAHMRSHPIAQSQGLRGKLPKNSADTGKVWLSHKQTNAGDSLPKAE